MRVLTITNMYPTPDRPSYGGFVRSQVESLRAAGVETDAVFIDGATSKANYVRGILEVRRRAREARYELVHAHYGLTGIVARAQSELPLVVSFCGDDILGTADARNPGTRTPQSLAIAAACQALTEVCEGIIVKSPHMRDRLWSARSRRRARVIPNGVDLAWAQPMARDEALARIGGLDPTKRYVLFPNAPHIATKRIELARSAVSRLTAHRPNAELLVVHGQPREIMPTYYAVADVLLLTSESEGSPNVVKEALACEVPVVSVPVGDVGERLQGAPSCSIVERDPDALACALNQALANPRPGGLRARVQGLSDDVIAQQIIDLYRDVLSRSRISRRRYPASRR